MKKNIMLMVPMLHQGGFERICALTAKLLKDKYNVTIVVFTRKNMFYDVSGINLIDLELGAVPGKIGKVINVFKRVSKVKKLKKELGIDITYSFGQTANIVNVLSKCQDITWAGIRGYGALEDFEMKFIAKRADKVVSCTKVMESEILSRFNIKSSATLYNPCNLEEIEKLSQEEISDEYRDFLNRPGKTIVSMGREDDIKGFWHLIKSVYLIKKKIPDIKLMIIGAGEFNEYKELAKNLGIENDVLFTGVQKNPFALLARADVYALTSDTEGFPNALIEAMLCGLPCVSVNCKTGPAEILNEDYDKCENQQKIYKADYGILTPIFIGSKDLDASNITEEEKIYANQVIELINDDTIYEEYKKKSKARVKCYGMEAYVKAIEAIM